MERRIPRLLATALRPASTRLTSPSSLSGRKEDHPVPSEPVRTPGTPAALRTARPEDKQT